MQRREFLASTATVGAAAAAVSAAANAVAQDAPKGGKFKLNYAPHFDMFKASAGDDVVDQLRYGRDLGFTAWEDNWMVRRPPAEQEKIAKAMSDLGIQMGIFVCHADMGNKTFSISDKTPEGKAAREKVLADMKQSVEVA